MIIRRSKKKTNDQQTSMQKTKAWATKIPLKTGSEFSCSGRINSSCFTYGTTIVKYFTEYIPPNAICVISDWAPPNMTIK